MTPRRTALALALILAWTAVTLTLMGRPLICTCGWVELWHGANDDSGNSQHLIDWYTPSHVLHGLIFYAALARLAPRWTLGARLTAATLVELSTPVNVPVHFHVITSTSGAGKVSASQINQQIQVLNDSFASADITFTLASTDTTASRKWYGVTPGSRAEREMKTALHKGDAGDLNLSLIHI